MEPFYRQTFTVTDEHVDCFGRLKLSMLLYFAQEAAGRHSALLGADYDSLAQKHLFWAVTRHKVQITRLPTLGQTVTVETWPMPTTKVAYPRAMVAYDADGNELFCSISLWVLMDSRSRSMILPGKSGVLVDGTLRGNELSIPRSLISVDLGQEALRTVTYSCLDRNGHMNNTRYLDWVDDLLTADYHRDHTAREFVICYASEAREGQMLRLGWSLDPQGCLQVEARREDEKKDRVFSAQVLFN